MLGLLSLALIFGGLWSYETLGWGGYWAWDPVEVIQLIPWLLITASMHSFALSHKLYGLFIASSLTSVYYGFMVVRSGLSPIHGFASPQALTAYVCLASIALIAFASYMYFKEVNVKINGLYDLSLVLSIF
ncbi:MAG: cytochrome c biogenesis protein CcsA [Acidilobaceae archaeon]